MLRFRRFGVLLSLFAALLLLAAPAEARVLRVAVDSQAVVLDGRAFGAYGAYEMLWGRIMDAPPG